MQPDTAIIVLSVVTQNSKALDAQQENARKIDAVIHALQDAAGANAEIKTSDYSLQPQEKYEYNRLPSIIGYEARNTVTATLSDLSKVGAAIDAASRASANNVQRVSFIVRENNPSRGQILGEATQQAMSKAQSIAQALGGRVVRVVAEHEGAGNYYPTEGSLESDDLVENADTSLRERRAAMAMASKAAGPTPVEAGTLNVKSQVQLVVEIETRP